MKKLSAETTASGQQGGNMRVIYHGYALTMYGKSSMSITDREGREVEHSNDFKAMTEDEAKKYLKDYLKGDKHES